MVQHLLVFLLLSSFNLAFGQDERFYRQILNGELPSLTQEIKEVPQAQFNVTGAAYHVDLNSDGIEEIIQPQKRDGVDWIEIQDSSRRKIFDAKLPASGGDSAIYKVRFAKISDVAKVLIVFLDEGQTSGRRFESVARLFLIAFENNDLTSMRLTVGPHHFHEREGQRDQYSRRDYQVELRDLNKDGVKDIMVHFNHIQRIMLYKGRGEWERL